MTQSRQPVTETAETSPVSRLQRALLHRPTAVRSWALALALAGALAATRLSVEWLPSIHLPELTVNALWPNASAEAVERFVTAPIERELQGIRGTVHIESFSEAGRAFVRLEAARDVALDVYMAEVRERLSRLRQALPERIVARVDRQVPEALRDQTGFMTLELVGAADFATLRRLADDLVAPAVESLPGIASVQVSGGRQQELRVSLLPDRMDAYGITVDQVRAALLSGLGDRAYGELRSAEGSRLLLTAALGGVDEIAAVPLAPSGDGASSLLLRDVTDIEVRPAELRDLSRIDGKPAVTLTLNRAAGSHLLQLAGLVNERVASLNAQLPAGIRLNVADDRSREVREQLDDLVVRGGAGLILTVFVLAAMLRSWRASWAVLASAGVSLATALLLLKPFDLTLNLVTLSGLVLIFGLLVDNAVVVMEQLQIQGRRHPGLGAVALAEKAQGAVWLPLVGSTLSTIAALVPLAYLSGDLRQLFQQLGLVTATVLGISLFGSVLLVPVLAWPVKQNVQEPAPARPGAAKSDCRALRRALLGPYRLAARFPQLTLALLLLVLGIPAWLLPQRLEPPEDGRPRALARLATLYNATLGSSPMSRLRTELDPALGGVLRLLVEHVESGSRGALDTLSEIQVFVRLPSGSDLEQTDRLIRRFEEPAVTSPIVERIVAIVGLRSAFLRVLFPKSELATAGPLVLREELIERALPLAGIEVDIHGLSLSGYSSLGGGLGAGFSILAYGSNYRTLEEVMKTFARRLLRHPRINGVDLQSSRFGFPNSRSVYMLRWPASAVRRSGLEAGALASLLRSRLVTETPVGFTRLADDTRLPIRLVVREPTDVDFDALMRRPLRTAGEPPVSLGDLASVALETRLAGIERYDQQYRRYMRVFVRGPYELGQEILEEELNATVLPAGYRLERESYVFFSEKVAVELLWLLVGVVAVVFLSVAGVLESWRLPAVVFASLPTAVIGVSVAVLWSDARFAEGAFLGVVLLFGIAVNDNILLIDQYRRLLSSRRSARKATLAMLALRQRLRPMWATTLTSIAGLGPLLVAAPHDSFWFSFAVVVIGGLISSTVLGPAVAVSFLSWGTGPSTPSE